MWATLLEGYNGKPEIRIECHKNEKVDMFHLFKTLIDESDFEIEPVDSDGLMVPIFGGNDYAYYQIKVDDWIYDIDDSDVKRLQESGYTYLWPTWSWDEWTQDSEF